MCEQAGTGRRLCAFELELGLEAAERTVVDLTQVEGELLRVVDPDEAAAVGVVALARREVELVALRDRGSVL
eukprot:scaffold85378_cov60-Phaeocystis_antarctica.AAC.2